MSAWGLPPVPLLRASGARCWAGGPPPPSSPLRPLALGAGSCSGGSLVSVRPVLGPRAPCACWRPPYGLSVSPRGGFPCRASNPPPPPGAARPGRALLGGGSPSSFPPSSAARVRPARPFGGALLLRRLVGRVRLFACTPWGFVPPLCLLCCSVVGAVLALTGPPTDAAGAAPVECAGMYPASLWVSSSVRSGPADWASHRRFQSRADGVCCRAPCAAGSILCPCICLRVLLRRCALWRCSVSAIGRILPVGSGSG